MVYNSYDIGVESSLEEYQAILKSDCKNRPCPLYYTNYDRKSITN